MAVILRPFSSPFYHNMAKLKNCLIFFQICCIKYHLNLLIWDYPFRTLGSGHVV